MLVFEDGDDSYSNSAIASHTCDGCRYLFSLDEVTSIEEVIDIFYDRYLNTMEASMRFAVEDPSTFNLLRLLRSVGDLYTAEIHLAEFFASTDNFGDVFSRVYGKDASPVMAACYDSNSCPSDIFDSIHTLSCQIAVLHGGEDCPMYGELLLHVARLVALIDARREEGSSAGQ